MISYVLPTRDRPECLAATLRGLGELDRDAHETCGGAEVIVVDNASATIPDCPAALENGLPVRLIRRDRNEGAAARNIGVEEALGEWIVMLDDDSRPLDAGLVEAIRAAPCDVAAIGAEIFLNAIRTPSTRPEEFSASEDNPEFMRREAGGLPEVFVGCGVAIRRDAFLECGGYDPAFHFYVEEYDLAARMILHGMRVIHDPRFRVIHEKSTDGRDMNLILRRLVRNNAWVMQRYAPSEDRVATLRETLARYGRIARKELAFRGYAHGLIELAASLSRQPRSPLSREQFDRFTGLAAARKGLSASQELHGGARAAIVDADKNGWAVRQALEELGVTIVQDERDADALVIGTLSPGPMMDAWERRAAAGQPVVRPWSMQEAPVENSAVLHAIH